MIRCAPMQSRLPCEFHLVVVNGLLESVPVKQGDVREAAKGPMASRKRSCRSRATDKNSSQRSCLGAADSFLLALPPWNRGRRDSSPHGRCSWLASEARSALDSLAIGFSVACIVSVGKAFECLAFGGPD